MKNAATPVSNKPGNLPLRNAVMIRPGQSLQARYNWLKSPDRDSYMGALSATNRRTLILTPGKFIVGALLTLDTDYVDIVGLSIDPEGTVVERAGGGSVIEQTADTINLSGFKIYNSGDSAGDHGFEIDATDNSLSIYRFMDFRKTNAKASTFTVLGTSDINGTWEYCTGGDYFFYVAANKDISGTFRFCTGGDYSFGKDTGGVVSGEFIHCIGGDYSFGGCAGQGMDCSGNFYYCTAGDKSFAMGKEFSGLAVDCMGGDYCFAGYDGGANFGTFSGEARDCIASNASLGSGHSSCKCSGTLIRCRATALPEAMFCEGARIEDSYIQITGANKDCLDLNDGNTKVYNSTLITNGTGKSISAGEAQNVVAVHCRANLALDGNVTNLVANGVTVDSDIT